ncbi:MAG TPA: ankyrin repeat domain-containing protein [Hyphomicrobiaceae bacterium]|nr:ankyrin repeat domain-containing protein [Hyphomicrobiaceae bacterium]
MTDTPGKPDAKNFVQPLPANPDLEKQRKLAKSLARDFWRGEAEAIARVTALHPKPPATDTFSLSDAQLVVARGYGFASWAKLKHKIDGLTKTPVELFVAAVKAGDVDGVRDLLTAHPDIATRINEPLFDFKQMAVHAAHRNLAMLDLLLAHGADINAKSTWEHGGFGILENVMPKQAAPLIARGAAVDIWAAANLGMVDRVKDLIDADPALVNAKGGDGKRPLHYARTVEIAEFLLDSGAQIDALDDDHSSTPVQHLIGDNVDVCRFLATRGAKTDLLLATALGDLALVRRHLDEDPASIGMRVSRDWFPMIDTAPNGGHIYQWTLGFHVSAFDIARERDHKEVLDLLLSRASPLDRVMHALWSGDDDAVDAVLATDPAAIEHAPPQVLRQVADAARNNNTAAVKAMLARGFSVATVSQHGATPLHWAAFHGNPDMLHEVLRYGPPLEMRDRDFNGTAMGWVIQGAMNHWHGISTAKHGACARLLLDAGAQVDETALPTGNDDLDQVLRAHFLK